MNAGVELEKLRASVRLRELAFTAIPAVVAFHLTWFVGGWFGGLSEGDQDLPNAIRFGSSALCAGIAAMGGRGAFRKQTAALRALKPADVFHSELCDEGVVLFTTEGLTLKGEGLLRFERAPPGLTLDNRRLESVAIFTPGTLRLHVSANAGGPVITRNLRLKSGGDRERLSAAVKRANELAVRWAD